VSRSWPVGTGLSFGGGTRHSSSKRPFRNSAKLAFLSSPERPKSGKRVFNRRGMRSNFVLNSMTVSFETDSKVETSKHPCPTSRFKSPSDPKD
jgi:hypothetical protein